MPTHVITKGELVEMLKPFDDREEFRLEVPVTHFTQKVDEDGNNVGEKLTKTETQQYLVKRVFRKTDCQRLHICLEAMPDED